MNNYNNKVIEKKWQKYWKENKTFFTDLESSKPKYYVLDMFPYPSGTGLHIGHPRGYTSSDIVAKYKKLKGFEVLHPIGWDSFGLPAEQYAIENNKNPKSFVDENISNFRNQLKSFGFSFDYSKEVKTSDPNYYKWTQWIFKKMFENGLAKKEKSYVNWCEKLGTVLANEEILIEDGQSVSERGKYPVTKKTMEQWILLITKYADRLSSDLDNLNWPQSIVKLQKNWIGEKKGYEINLRIKNSNHDIKIFFEDFKFLENGSFVAIAPENPIIQKLDNPSAEEYARTKRNIPDIMRAKTYKNFSSFDLKIKVVNPLNQRELPVFIVDFVTSKDCFLSKLGTPEANQKDQNFCEENNIPYNKNLRSNTYTFDKKLNKKSFFLLKDWVFSRQRYWGEPIPVYYDTIDKTLKSYSEKDLPLLLPELDDYQNKNDGNICALSRNKQWIVSSIDTHDIVRDANTMPQWAGSCWYFLAYILHDGNGGYLDLNSAKAKKRLEKWMPVDLYIGGQEHAVLHLLYARFWNLFLYDLGIVKEKEPFVKLKNQGMILGKNGEKMSKSKGNGVNPDPLIKKYGADSIRIYQMFSGPLSDDIKWDEDGLISSHKWLRRVIGFFEDKVNKTCTTTTEHISSLIKKAEHNIENLKFNLLVSELMIYINQCYKLSEISIVEFSKFLIVLSCIAPHISEELWNKIGNEKSIFESPWPKTNKVFEEKKTFNLIIQINGKKRGNVIVLSSANEEEIIKNCSENKNVTKYIKNQKIKKIVYIKGRVINFVV